MCKKTLCFILIFLLLPCAGCYDAIEIDELAYVVAVGIDKSESNTFRITFQYAVPLNIASGIDGSKGEEAPLNSLTFDTDSLHLALDTANSKIAKITDLSHLSVILIGEEAAKTDLDYLREDIKTVSDLRHDACMAICEGKAEEKLNSVSSPLELSPTRFYTDFFANPASGYGLKQTVAVFLQKHHALALPFLQKNNPFEISGMAVLKEDSLLKIYLKEDILLYNLLKSTFSDLKYETENGVYRIDARSKPQIKIRAESNPVISVSLDLTGEPLSGKDFLFSDNKRAVQDITDTLKKDVSAFLEKTKRDNCDLMFFEQYARPCFATEKELKQYKWSLKYPFSAFSVHINFRNTKTN